MTAAREHVIKVRTERGHQKLLLSYQGPLKILMRKLKGHEKLLFIMKITSTLLPGINNY